MDKNIVATFKADLLRYTFDQLMTVLIRKESQHGGVLESVNVQGTVKTIKETGTNHREKLERL